MTTGSPQFADSEIAADEIAVKNRRHCKLLKISNAASHFAAQNLRRLIAEAYSLHRF